MKKLVMLILVTALIFCSAGCAGGTTPDPSPAAETSANVPPTETETSDQPTTEQSQDEPTQEAATEKKWKIAMSAKNETNPYWIRCIEGARFAEEEIGNVQLDVISSPSEKDIEDQIHKLDTMLTQDYDCILFAPISDATVIPWMKRANEQGMPILNYDTIIDQPVLDEAGVTVISKVYMDHTIVGNAAGEAMAEALGGKGKIAVLQGVAGSSSGEKRKGGFYDVIEKYPDIEVVANEDCKFNRNDAYNAMASIATAYPDLDGVYACDDEMILGALSAIEEAGIDPTKMILIGANFAEEVWQPMAEGKIYGSPTNEPGYCGYASVHAAVDYLEGYPILEDYVSVTKMTYKEDVANAEDMFRPLVWERLPKE